MNPKFDSYLRHVFTAWITAAVVALSAWLTLSEAEVKAVTEGFSKMGDGLLIVLAVVVPAAGRLLWAWAAKFFRAGSGEVQDPQGPSGGVGLILMLAGTAAVLGGLPSCSAESINAARAVPIRACIATEQGQLCYSSKAGLSVEVSAK